MITKCRLMLDGKGGLESMVSWSGNVIFLQVGVVVALFGEKYVVEIEAECWWLWMLFGVVMEAASSANHLLVLRFFYGLFSSENMEEGVVKVFGTTGESLGS